MANLRIISINVEDSSTITAKFSEKLSRDLSTSNITLIPQLDIPIPDVLSIDINQDILTITTQPLTPTAPYIIVFKSTTDSLFKSINGTSVLFEDGITNQQLILGPPEDDNVVKDFLINYLRKNVLNITDTTTLANKIIQGFSLFFSKSLYDIKQLKNENYVSYKVTDEQYTRGTGPFDRLNEEGAYEVSRVGRNVTGSLSTLTNSFDIFPTSPVTLQAESVSDNLVIASSVKTNSININNLVITVEKQNVTKLEKVVFIYNDARPDYTYSIKTLGYQILDSKYDQDFGFSYLILENNQFKLSNSILSDINFSTENIDRVEIIYQYKNLGRIINPDSVSVNTLIDVVREVLPPIVNIFNLKHANIVNDSGETPTINGISFLDPNTLGSIHPAFLYEIPFGLNNLPGKAGEYSIDYPNGKVYVFGASTTNDGTGPTPPLASYTYNYFYKEDLDYTYDPDFNDIAALPFGSLIDNQGNINFAYEQVLVPGIDYESKIHIEELSERIENRLVALNAFKVKNTPITNVFRIYNETSGEIYNTIRWSSDKVYFSYNTPPNIAQNLGERASFTDVLNEILFVNSTLTNSSSIKVYKCLLENNNIIGSTEDSIGSSINSSAKFSDLSFEHEKWFDINASESSNIDRLEIGEYLIDYANGIVYLAVDNDSLNIGTISYKSNSIVPQFPHIISVDDIYNRITVLNPKDKIFQYSSFEDGSIIPDNLDVSDEAFFNSAYVLSNQEIGTFVDASFEPGVASNIKFIRGVYSFDDLKYNIFPLNFAENSTFSGTTITVGSIERQEYTNVAYNVTDGYYVDINFSLFYQSNNITFDISVLRGVSQLWDNSGVVVTGETVRLRLSGINSPNIGDSVIIDYSFTINDLSRVIVDYNKGELYIDYTYLADEIIVSYEYGENLLDFRKSNSVSPNDVYYVTYKVGALRDGLLKNFGTLINIPQLSNFNVDLERERYRDAISAALESFVQGPTIGAMENVVEKITHVKPEIIESIFQSWSLGTSYLTPRSFETEGKFSLLPAKHDNGVLITNQVISLPGSSNFRLENGTFQSWIIPQWDGIDNNVPLNFIITKDGYTIPSNQIFLGASENHPIYENNSFSVDKFKDIGTPNMNKPGIFIYYENDPSNLFKRWYLRVFDGYGDGYINRNYSIKITSPGLFYDVKTTATKPSYLSIISGTGKVTINFNGISEFDDTITFIADREYYIFDHGETINKNRISLFKDPSGYVNLRVYDKFSNVYSVSGDVSSWKANEQHHVAASWTLNSKYNQDELHLFIDGFEVPNIIKYGNFKQYLHEKFRTVNPEEITSINKNIVSSIDLVTTIGSPLVSSSLNFDDYGILAGDSIHIDEIGFDPDGYTIVTVNGNDLILNANMPMSLTDGRFTINRTRINVETEINIYPNIAVSTISPILDGYDLNITNNSDSVYSSINFEDEGIVAGSLLRIDGYNFEKHYVILDVNDGYLTLNDLMPETAIKSFFIYPNEDVEIPGVRALRPSYAIEQDGYDGYVNNVLVLNNNVSSNDLVFIKTLGVNHRKIKQKYYQWGNSSNIIQTILPPPVDLDSVKIFHVILPTFSIKPSPFDGYNATISLGNFTSNTFTAEQPSNSTNGRTLQVTISSNNLDFTVATIVSITGLVNGSPTTEMVNFTEIGSQNTVNKFSTVTSVVVTGKPINVNKVFLTLTIKEAYSITISENSTTYPVIKYSYQTNAGTTLSGSGTTLTNINTFFSSQNVGNYLIITYPPAAAGTYQITAVNSSTSITISTSLPSFTGGYYQILNSSTARSGFQNGYFLLEQPNSPTAYNLKQGIYEFEYYSYLNIKLDPIDKELYFGSDLNKKAHLNGILDEVVINSNKLTDTRVGEVVGISQQSITKDFNSLKQLRKNINTLVLSHFDNYPFVNEAEFYTNINKNVIQSGYSVNDNFQQSICLTNKPYIIENNGIFNKNEGTIEFWVNPMFETYNDPNYRYYFDATGLNIEEVTSLNSTTVQVSGRINKVISVKVGEIDYFVGGKVELSNQGATVETVTSTNTNTVTVSKNILQVITVKIAGDATNTDYFDNGIIGTDKRTIYLGKTLPQSSLSLVITYKVEGLDNSLNTQVIRLHKPLPSHKTVVKVTYVPSGLQGDRVSIFKDPSGFINFLVTANNLDYLVRAPAVWSRNTWHRIKATYKVNGGKSRDEIRLFIDGYERGNALFGTGLVFGTPVVMGSSSVGTGGIISNIKIKDIPNELFIGSDFTENNGSYALINNLRISNIARPVYAPYGESIDVNYTSNESAFPVTEDLYTTLLLDINGTLEKKTDFVTLNNKNSGGFNFAINIFDSFGILNEKIQDVLETLIKVLKPANSRVFIKYVP